MALQLKEGDKMYFFIKNFKKTKQETGPCQNRTIFDQKGQKTTRLRIEFTNRRQNISSVQHFFVGTNKSRHTIGNNLSLPHWKKRRIRNGKDFTTKWSGLFHQMEELWRDRRYLKTSKKFGNCQTFLRQFRQSQQQTNRNFQKRNFPKPRQTKSFQV